MKQVELAIIGAGPAGLAAADEAARRGVSVALIDDNALPGGQYFRQLPSSFRRLGTTVYDKGNSRASALLQAAGQRGVELLSDTVVWDAPDRNVLAYAGPNGAGRITAQLILIATGAYDRPVPFPGWTLPGVVTAGGVQNLLKGQRMIPGRRAVVAGNGPLLLVAAATLLRAGADVAEVIEAAPIYRRLAAQVGCLAAAPKILRQAIEYRILMARRGARLRTAEIVIEALGDDAVREVVVAPVEPDGRVVRERRRVLAADTLVIGFGLRSSTEMVRLLGCALSYDPDGAQWLPVRNADLETSVPNVFAAGDGAGIGGVEMALSEGRLVGMVAARRLRPQQGARPSAEEQALRARLARMERFRKGLNRLYAPPASYLNLITPQTTICRCEEITAKDIAGCYNRGYCTSFAVKGATRIGMGRCQGRNCMGALADLLALEGGETAESIQMPRMRPPLRPVLIGDLLLEDVPPPDALEDPHLPRGETVS